MWFQLIILLQILHLLSSFTFLYPDESIKTYYKYQESIKTKIVFNITKQLLDIPLKFDTAWDSLRTPFNISFKDTMNAGDSTLLQAEDFFMTTAQISDIASKYETFVAGLTPIPLDIDIARTINIHVDEAVLNQRIKNIQITTAFIEIKMNESVTLANLKKDQDKLSKMLLAYDNLNTDAHTLLKQYESFFRTIHLTSFKIMTDYLRGKILPINSSNVLDTLNYEFLNAYVEDNNPVFILQLYYLRNPINYKKLYSIPYNSISLDNNYIINIDTQQIEQLYTQDQIASGIAQHNEKCLEQINNHGNNATNVKQIIENCNFIQNLKPFQTIKNGLIVYRISNDTMKSINNQLKTNIMQKDLPFVLTFNNTLNIYTSLYGNTSITRSDNFSQTYSNLTSDERLTITRVNAHFKTQYDFTNLDLLLLENYPIIIVTILINITLFAIFLMLTSVNKCVKPKKNALSKMVEKRRQQQERNRRAYRLRQY